MQCCFARLQAAFIADNNAAPTATSLVDMALQSQDIADMAP